MRKLSPLLLALLFGGLTASCSLIVRNKLDDDEQPREDGGVGDLSQTSDRGEKDDLPVLPEGGVFPVAVSIKRERDAHGEPYLIGERFSVQLQGEGQIIGVWLQPLAAGDPWDPEMQPPGEIWCPCEEPVPLDEPGGEPLPGDPQPGDPQPPPPVQERRCSIPPRAPEGPVELRVEYEANQGSVAARDSFSQEITIQRLLVAGVKGAHDLWLFWASDLSEQGPLPLLGELATQFVTLSPSGRYLLLADEVAGPAPGVDQVRYAVVDLITQALYPAPVTVNKASLGERVGVFEGRYDHTGTPLPELALWVLGAQKTPVKLALPSDPGGELVDVSIGSDFDPNTQQLVALRWFEQSVIVGMSSMGPSSNKLSWLTPAGSSGSIQLDDLTSVQAIIPVQEAPGGNDSLVLLGTRNNQSTGSPEPLIWRYQLTEANGWFSLESKEMQTLETEVTDLGPIPGTGFFSLHFPPGNPSPLQFGWLQNGRLSLPVVNLSSEDNAQAPWRVLPTAYGSELLAATVLTNDPNDPNGDKLQLFTLFSAPAAPSWENLEPIYFPLLSRYIHHPVDQRFFTLQPAGVSIWSYDFGSNQAPAMLPSSSSATFSNNPLDTALLIQP